ncbi:phosphotriesterase-like protein [Atlantibacter hermannii]|nr:phosphotriesterase-like protein [Atlantibacter hermannii]
MGFIRTLTGDIAPQQLGVTYSHDHLYCIPPYWQERNEEDLLLDDKAASERELADFRAAGGQSIYDATAPDYGRHVEVVAEIATRQGVQIIATAGFNKGFLWSSKRPGTDQSFAEWIANTSIDALVEHVSKEVTDGIDGTSYRAGMVKCGTGYNAISPLERKTMEVVVRAQQATNAPMHSHTEMGTMALEQAAILNNWALICPAFALRIWIEIPIRGYTVNLPTPGHLSRLTVSAGSNISPSMSAPKPFWRCAKRGTKNRS